MTREIVLGRLIRLASARCKDSLGQEYLAHSLDCLAQPSMSSALVQWRVLKVRLDRGVEVIRMNLKLTGMVYNLLAEVWPPEFIWDFRFEGEELVIDYPVVRGRADQTILPFDLGRAGVWQGRLSFQERGWRVRRLSSIPEDSRARTGSVVPGGYLKIDREEYEEMIKCLGSSFEEVCEP